MSPRRSLLIGTAIVAGGLLWYLFRPDALVISKTVNESLPAAEEAEMAHRTMAASSAMGGSGEMGSMGEAAEPVRLARGRFHTNAHETQGLATIYRLEDGRRVLRLTEFRTSNGPDVRVYLVAAADVQHEEVVKQAGIVDLGALKGNIGDQNYDVPPGLDLTSYRAVSIWCRRFSVNFGAAPLADTM
jgi:electron transfer DM13